MPPKRIWVSRTVCTFAIVLLTSCDTVHVHRRPNPGRGPGIGHGPPAHAKAHGYHRKQVCGHDLVYDTTWGVYVVVGVTDCYYHDGHFYRLSGDRWQISLRADSGWGPVGRELLPPGLRGMGQAKVHAKAETKVSPNLEIRIKSPLKGKGRAKGKW